jgi:hypothetical protein
MHRLREEVILRILALGAVVEKIQNFEVSGLVSWIFLRLRTFLELFFKF